MNSVIKLGPLLLYGSPIYPSACIERVPSGLTLPLFGKRSFSISEHLVYRLKHENGDRG